MSQPYFLASRAWLLMLLEGAERNGIFLVPMAQLHRYIYLGNVLSPICNLIMPESYTLKHMRGPYFPRAQWDIGRLLVAGLVEANNFEPYTDDDGFWLAADYRITEAGVKFVKELTEHDLLHAQANYLRELMCACSVIPKEEFNKAMQIDFHYSRIQQNKIVNFSSTDGNMAKKAALEMFPEDRSYTPTEGVHRYIDYLSLASVG